MAVRPIAGLTVRSGVPGDSDACADIHLQARAGWRFLPHELHTREETHAWMRNIVFAAQRVCVAEVDGRIAGYLARDGALLEGLYIAPAYQDRGIGTALLNMAKDESPDGLSLWVFEANGAAIRFYERHGFQIRARTDGRGNQERLPDCQMSWPQ